MASQRFGTIIYTSGTTEDQELMLSHQNIFKRIGGASRIPLKQEKPCTKLSTYLPYL
jgi:long-subunit acyl-CoA synthetase (AMP-forming)